MARGSEGAGAARGLLEGPRGVRASPGSLAEGAGEAPAWAAALLPAASSLVTRLPGVWPCERLSLPEAPCPAHSVTPGVLGEDVPWRPLWEKVHVHAFAVGSSPWRRLLLWSAPSGIRSWRRAVGRRGRLLGAVSGEARPVLPGSPGPRA